jgi:excinuclease ABC subunit A
MVSYSDEQIKDLIIDDFRKTNQYPCSVIRARKDIGELFQQIAKQGFLKVRVNGDVLDITPGMKLDRYKTTISKLWWIVW